MKKETQKLAEAAIGLQQNMNALTMDEIERQEPEALVQVQEMSMKERAKLEGAVYLEPKRRLSPPLGTLPDKQKKEHAHAWEYVKGMYENYVVNGEPLTFALCLYAGDPDLLWEIPANVPVYIPRHVAKHLEEVQKYHTFNYLEVPTDRWHADEFTHQFGISGTHYRGKFRAIGAFS